MNDDNIITQYNHIMQCFLEDLLGHVNLDDYDIDDIADE